MKFVYGGVRSRIINLQATEQCGKTIYECCHLALQIMERTASNFVVRETWKYVSFCSFGTLCDATSRSRFCSYFIFPSDPKHSSTESYATTPENVNETSQWSTQSVLCVRIYANLFRVSPLTVERSFRTRWVRSLPLAICLRGRIQELQALPNELFRSYRMPMF